MLDGVDLQRFVLVSAEFDLHSLSLSTGENA
jgi:hypothetical protein